MQRLYVVGFNVAVTEPAGAEHAFDLLIEHFAPHLGTDGLAVQDLLPAPGAATVSVRHLGRPDKQLSWTPVAAGVGVRALRLAIDDDLPDGGRFTCELTAAESEGDTSFRVVMGRSTSGRITPARIEKLKPPAALRSILGDSSLTCDYRGEVLTNTVSQSLADQVPAVLARLNDPARRFPILVVSAMHPKGPSATLARKAAVRLAGLCHVVAIHGWLALDSFNRAMQANALPRAGARLYWPYLDLRAPWWSANTLASDHDDLLGQMMRLLAPLSVVARGRDQVWDAVRAKERSSRSADMSASETDRISALQQEVEEERAFSAEVTALNEELEDKNARLEVDVANLQARLNAATRTAWEEPESDLSSSEAVSSPDFTADWARWELESGGALVFTENAKKQWSKCAYPKPEQMREALDALALLADAWREANGNVGKDLTSWMAEEVGLTLSLHDNPLRTAGKHLFGFEGVTWDRTPHIKVADHTSPNQVGRIYFAIDNTGRRWVVDHVGLKLYGI